MRCQELKDCTCIAVEAVKCGRWALSINTAMPGMRRAMQSRQSAARVMVLRNARTSETCDGWTVARPKQA